MKNDVRELRGIRCLTQAELAAAMRVSRQTINAIELCRFFGKPVEEVFHAEQDGR